MESKSFQQWLNAVPAEKLLVNEALWDEDTITPSEHQAIVLDRITKAKQNPERLIDWEKASKVLQS